MGLCRPPNSMSVHRDERGDLISRFHTDGSRGEEAHDRDIRVLPGRHAVRLSDGETRTFGAETYARLGAPTPDPRAVVLRDNTAESGR